MKSITILAISAFTLALTACGAPDSGGRPSPVLQTQALPGVSGVLDPTYGTAGIVHPDGQFSAGLAIQQNGAALVLTGSGRFTFPPGLTTTLTRLTRYGQPDATFGQRGVVQLPGGAGALALVCPNGANPYNDWGATCNVPERTLVAVTFTSRDTLPTNGLKALPFLAFRSA